MNAPLKSELWASSSSVRGDDTLGIPDPRERALRLHFQRLTPLKPPGLFVPNNAGTIRCDHPVMLVLKFVAEKKLIGNLRPVWQSDSSVGLIAKKTTRPSLMEFQICSSRDTAPWYETDFGKFWLVS